MRTKAQDLAKVKAYQKRLRDSGICLKCRNSVDVMGKINCSSCQEKERIRLLKWKHDNKSKVKLSTKKYYAKNSVKERKRLKDWELANKEKTLLARKFGKYEYKHRRKVAGRFSLSDWKTLCLSFGNRCLWCERTNIELTVDHVVPLIKGGSNFIENIQPLCRVCNSKKHDKIIDFRPFGSAILEWT